MNLSTDDSFGLRGRWVTWRNRLLASPQFHRFATRWPVFRSVARRQARSMFDLVAGFTYSQVLAASVESGLLDALARGPRDTAALAIDTGLPRGGVERLLRAAASLGLVEPLGPDGWALGVRGAAMRGNGGVAEMVAHHRLVYADLADPVTLLRSGGGGGALAGLWRYAEGVGSDDPDSVAYSALMAASQPMVAAQAIDAYPFHRHQRLLDVGGGEGVFLAAVGARVPRLELGLFDLPPVVARARARLDSLGLRNRVTTHGGDFLRGPLPVGFDVITLVRVLHDHDDAPAMALLTNIHAALPPGGTLVIAEPMAGVRGVEAPADAYFGLYLLAMGSGRARTPKEIADMLRQVGFAGVRRVRTAMPLTASALAAVRA
jgi:demethylspheroidene O-methyltransferase